MIAYERRASTILFNFLASNQASGPVLLPANVCPIVPLTLHKAGRRFEFVDISPSTLCIDHEKLLERWNSSAERPAGLIYVRTFGAIFDAMELFDEIKQLSPDALIIDDRCACMPSFAADTLIENVDAVLYSTGYAKYADIGFGGYAFLRSETPYMRARLPYDQHDLELQETQYKRALIRREEFSYLENAWLDFTEPVSDWDLYRKTVEGRATQVATLKRAINQIYSDGLPPEIQLLPVFQSWRFNIHVANKSALLTAIQEVGLFASGHYDSLDGLFGSGSGENARMAHRHVVNLFNDLHFDVERAALLADVIRNAKGLAPSPLKL